MTALGAAPSRRPSQRPTPGRRDGAAHLRIAPRNRRRGRARLAMWGASAVTVASLFVLVGFHVVAVQHAFELDHLAAQRADAQRRYERLRYEVALQSSPAVVVEAARAEGLVTAAEVGYLTVPDAPASAPVEDRTGETLVTTWDEARRSLEP